MKSGHFKQQAGHAAERPNVRLSDSRAAYFLMAYCPRLGLEIFPCFLSASRPW